MPELLSVLIAERSSAKLTSVLRDENQVPLPLADLDTLTLTFYLRADPRRIINERSAQDVKNANGCTYHSTSGLLTWPMTDLDNAIIGKTPPGRIEEHIALFEWTWAGDTKSGNHEYLIRVEARSHVP